MAPHQLFPHDEWGVQRTSRHFLAGDLPVAHQQDLRCPPETSGNSSIEDSISSGNALVSAVSLPKLSPNFRQDSSHRYSHHQHQHRDVQDSEPLCFSDLDDALDDDDDEGVPLDTAWPRRDFVAKRGVEIFVGGLTRSTRRDMLRDWFQLSGEVTDVRIARDKRRRRCRGYGYVRFATSEQANRAIEMMHRFEFKPGRFLGVLPSDENRTLFVGGLREEWSSEYVCSFLKEKMPGLTKVEPIPDREDRFKIRTFCFLEFATHSEAAVIFDRYKVEPPPAPPPPEAQSPLLLPQDHDPHPSQQVVTPLPECDVRGLGLGLSYFESTGRVDSSSSSSVNNGGVGDADVLGGAACPGSGNPSLLKKAGPAARASRGECTDTAVGLTFDTEGTSRPSFSEDRSRWGRSMEDDHGPSAAGDIFSPCGSNSGKSTPRSLGICGVEPDDLFVRGKALSGSNSDAGVDVGGAPLVVGGAVLKVDWADPLRYHIHLNGGIKGPSTPADFGSSDGRLSSRGGGVLGRGGPSGVGIGRHRGSHGLFCLAWKSQQQQHSRQSAGRHVMEPRWQTETERPRMMLGGHQHHQRHQYHHQVHSQQHQRLDLPFIHPHRQSPRHPYGGSPSGAALMTREHAYGSAETRGIGRSDVVNSARRSSFDTAGGGGGTPQHELGISGMASRSAPSRATAAISSRQHHHRYHAAPRESFQRSRQQSAEQEWSGVAATSFSAAPGAAAGDMRHFDQSLTPARQQLYTRRDGRPASAPDEVSDYHDQYATGGGGWHRLRDGGDGDVRRPRGLVRSGDHRGGDGKMGGRPYSAGAEAGGVRHATSPTVGGQDAPVQSRLTSSLRHDDPGEAVPGVGRNFVPIPSATGVPSSSGKGLQSWPKFATEDSLGAAAREAGHRSPHWPVSGAVLAVPTREAGGPRPPTQFGYNDMQQQQQQQHHQSRQRQQQVKGVSTFVERRPAYEPQQERMRRQSEQGWTKEDLENQVQGSWGDSRVLDGVSSVQLKEEVAPLDRWVHRDNSNSSSCSGRNQPTALSPAFGDGFTQSRGSGLPLSRREGLAGVPTFAQQHAQGGRQSMIAEGLACDKSGLSGGAIEMDRSSGFVVDERVERGRKPPPGLAMPRRSHMATVGLSVDGSGSSGGNRAHEHSGAEWIHRGTDPSAWQNDRRESVGDGNGGDGVRVVESQRASNAGATAQSQRGTWTARRDVERVVNGGNADIDIGDGLWKAVGTRVTGCTHRSSWTGALLSPNGSGETWAS